MFQTLKDEPAFLVGRVRIAYINCRMAGFSANEGSACAAANGRRLVVAQESVSDGSIHRSAARKTKAWIELNDESLLEMWQKAAKSEIIGKID